MGNEYLVDLAPRFTFAAFPLNHSLLKMDQDDNKLAVDCYGLFLKYLSSGNTKNMTEALSKISGKEILQNEFYCQCIKHTLSADHKPVTKKAAWEWLTMTSLAFSPPDKQLLEITEYYLELQGIEDPEQTIASLAQHALLQITRRKSTNPRTTKPTS